MQNEIHPLIKVITHKLHEINKLLHVIKKEDYGSQSPTLKDASIGAHCRHIIEFFVCLLEQYPQGVISYDKRERNIPIQTQPSVAIKKIEWIINHLDKPNKNIISEYKIFDHTLNINTCYTRELMYNLEHLIHHEVLIGLACSNLDYLSCPKEFGVAFSTLAFQSDVYS